MSRSTIPSKRPAEAQEAAWVADEDRFVLQQARAKAAIRVKGNRAQPIDWLAVTLAVIDPQRNPLDDELREGDLEMVDPESVFDGLSDAQLGELAKGIDTYLVLETSKSNLEYWNMMKTICDDRRKSSNDRQPVARGVGSVATDLDKLLGPKSLEELEKLEKQIKTKLASNDPLDTDYWEHLLRSLLTHKARARLRKVSHSVLSARLQSLRKQETADASALKSRLESADVFHKIDTSATLPERAPIPGERHPLDPEPMLRLRPEDRSLESLTLKDFQARLESERKRVSKAGYVPFEKQASGVVVLGNPEHAAKRQRVDAVEGGPAVLSAFDREVARGLGENEELFTQEVAVITKNRAQWPTDVKPRQPKYFNRVQLGYEWNKYNQTHYDHDNLPPRVVQGYKFNIFYPDLLDKLRAPTYRIERENGRRRGQLSAPAGEDDTCVIRFIAGAPYEDIAFRIVDKEWDYSAKRERGFRSSFDRGILQLHFQFKKIYYRK